MPPEEEAAIALDALAKNELQHAAHHIACALASDPTRPEWLELLEKIVANADDPLSLAPLEQGKPTWFGTAAVRARILARAGKLEEALGLLVQASAGAPEVDYMAWGKEWLAPAEAVKSVTNPELLSGLVLKSVLSVEAARHEPFTAWHEGLLALVDAVSVAHPRCAALLNARAGLLRRLGRLDNALRAAEALVATEPSWHSYVCLAMVHRARKDLESTLGAYRKALELDPSDVEARVDLADTLAEHERYGESQRELDEVLRREPKHHAAVPLSFYVRIMLDTTDPRPQKAFVDYVKRNPANVRAGQMLARAAALLAPYVGFLPDPQDATVNSLRQILSGKKPGQPIETSSFCTQIEPPSLSLIESVLRARHPKVDIKIGSPPPSEPDPRRPHGPVEYLLWRYEGMKPIPEVSPPRADVAKTIAELASAPYPRRWERSKELGASIGPDGLESLLGVMVHPPPLPANIAPWSWIFAVQVAAAFAIAHVDPGWTGSLRR
ncbi:tetratricopeptide repeat protein, partial [bacterium]|nr:tetratricopeptide repeat protein [bacterium]